MVRIELFSKVRPSQTFEGTIGQHADSVKQSLDLSRETLGIGSTPLRSNSEGGHVSTNVRLAKASTEDDAI